MKLLGISGSLRQGSNNTRLLSVAASLMPATVEFEIADCLDQLPHFNPDLVPDDLPVVRNWVDQVRGSDGLIISTPEYARGYPGTLKNSLDWLVQTDAHIDKPFMMLNASARSTVGQGTLITVLETMSGIHVESASVTIPLLGKNLDEQQILKNADWSEQIRRAVDTFASAISGRFQASEN